MRQSDVYKINVPELGDRSDITVVSDAILAGEKNTIGNVQWMKATNSGNIITLTSETRTAKMSKYYNGLAVQFVSPISITSASGAQIKVDNLEAQPFTTTNDIEVGNVVCAVYGSSGFTANKMGVAVIDNLTTADSKKALSANQGKVLDETKADKTTQIIAGNGLAGGGTLSNNITISVANADDSIVVNTNSIKVNTYNALDSSSTTRPLSANQGRILSEKMDDAVATVINKLDKGAVSSEYDTAKKIEDKIKEAKNIADNKVSKSGDLITGDLKFINQANGIFFKTINADSNPSIPSEDMGVYNSIIAGSDYAGFNKMNNITINSWNGISFCPTISGYAVQKYTPAMYIDTRSGSLNVKEKIITKNITANGTVDLTDNNLDTDAKKVIEAINESLWRRIAKDKKDITDLNNFNGTYKKGVYYIEKTESIQNKPVDNNENAFLEWIGFESNTGIMRYWYWSSSKVYRRYRLVNGTWTRWNEELDSGSPIFLGNSGVSSVKYIQDTGEKIKHNGYFDAVTGKLYRAKYNTSSTSVNNDFELATNIELSKFNGEAIKILDGNKDDGTYNISVRLSDYKDRTLYLLPSSGGGIGAGSASSIPVSAFINKYILFASDPINPGETVSVEYISDTSVKVTTSGNDRLHQLLIK